MNRRRYLRGVGAAGIGGLAGCLERLGFEEQSAWRDPPLVEDRPDAVYVPASTETMGRYGAASDGEYAASLSYTFPHRFWTVTDVDPSRVTVGADETHHLMCTVWDPETGVVLPVDMSVDLRRDGEPVVSFVPWPMLSQRMGFHYGDNVILPEEGAYAARIRVGPVQARLTGALAGRFGEATTLEVEFEYERSDVHDLAFDRVDRDRRGRRGALEPMDRGGMAHGGGNGSRDGDADPGPPPTARGPAVADLSGRHLGTERSGDARISALVTEADRLAGDRAAHFAVFLRSPYNRTPLPFTSVSATTIRDGEAVDSGPLRETIDHELGHHYGTGIDPDATDRVAVSVESAPSVARHDGYETAFFEFEDVSFDL